ncbi:MAG: hypothetical protein KDK24_20275 [Pseudooceanicola sp.]|nr:hypothetical protein [Pseudooceanicola sp.]
MTQTTFTLLPDTKPEDFPSELAKLLRISAVATPDDCYVRLQVSLTPTMAREIARRIDLAERPVKRAAAPERPALPPRNPMAGALICGYLLALVSTVFADELVALLQGWGWL